MGFYSLNLLVFLALAQPACAFTLEMQGTLINSGWSSHRVTIDLDPSCASESAVTDAVKAAINLWNSVPSSDLTLSYGTTQSLAGSITSYAPPNQPSYEGRLLIYCDTNFDTDFNVPADNIPGVDIAPTLNCASGQTFCPIKGGLVVLNTQASDSVNVISLNAYSPTLVQVVVAHEIGHALGLGHSASKNSLMYYDATAKKKLSLSQDDVDGISYLYPRNEAGGGSKVFGCGSLASVSNQKRSSGNNQEEHSAFFEFALIVLMTWVTSSFSRANWVRPTTH